MTSENPWNSDPVPAQNPWESAAVPTADPVDDHEPIAEPITTQRIDPLDFIEAMKQNQRNTWFLIFGVLLLTAAFGYVLGWAFDLGFGRTMAAGISYAYGGQINWSQVFLTPSPMGIKVAAVLMGGMTLWTLMALIRADKMVLNMADAREVDAGEMPQLHNVVEEMAIASGLPKPRIVVLPTPVPNAFATGLRQQNATVGVTQGLLDRLNRRELQGVIAHEMGHVLNGDMRYATILAVMTGVLVFIAEMILSLRYMRFYGGGNSDNRRGGNPIFLIIMIVVVILAAIIVPILARLIQMAISRQREYLADATATQLTRDPGSLISALKKISNLQEPSRNINTSLEPLFIVTPAKLLQNGHIAWFSTHPPLEKRIERLKALE